MTVDKFVPLSPEQAEKWIMTGEVEVFHNPFGEPPEAVAEAEPGATIYLRLPLSLKKQVEDAAQKDELSVNAWAMRCMEACLAAARKAAADAPLWPRLSR